MIRTYRNVDIDPKNYVGMYSALVPIYGSDRRYDIATAYIKVAADTLAGIKGLIRDVLDHGPGAVGL